MATPNYTKQLKDNGITATSDGLLCDFIYRGLYSAAVATLEESVSKRRLELKFLAELKNNLKQEILLARIEEHLKETNV